MNLAQKTAILTGATGGIGVVILDALVKDGYRVVACGRNHEKLFVLRDAYGKENVIPQVLDFLDCSGEIMRHYVDRMLFPSYRLDLLVCAHGAAPCTKPTFTLTDDDIDRIYRTDVLGTLLMAQACGPHMATQADGGSMVFISSAHAYATYPSRAPYAMAKASVVSLARALAVEWGKHKIRVNSVSPWQLEGERSQAIAAQERQEGILDTLELYRQRSPLRRLGTAEDVAKVVLMLAENQSMTGQDIRLDCGTSASMWHQGFIADGDG